MTQTMNPVTPVPAIVTDTTSLIPYAGDNDLEVFGFALPQTATIEQRLDLIDTLQSYIGVQAVKFDDLENKYFVGKNAAVKIDILGCVVKPLGLFAANGLYYDKLTGAERHGWITLIKFSQADEESRMLLFNSRAATDFARLLMSAFGSVADFPFPVTVQITKVPAKVGSTYTFQRVKATK